MNNFFLLFQNKSLTRRTHIRIYNGDPYGFPTFYSPQYDYLLHHVAVKSLLVTLSCPVSVLIALKGYGFRRYVQINV